MRDLSSLILLQATTATLCSISPQQRAIRLGIFLGSQPSMTRSLALGRLICRPATQSAAGENDSIHGRLPAKKGCHLIEDDLGNHWLRPDRARVEKLLAA